jgi:hypothetical protein
MSFVHGTMLVGSVIFVYMHVVDWAFKKSSNFSISRLDLFEECWAGVLNVYQL